MQKTFILLPLDYKPKQYSKQITDLKFEEKDM
jgi:hypothetical protein